MPRSLRDPAFLAVCACGLATLVGVGLLQVNGAPAVGALHGRPGVTVTTTTAPGPEDAAPAVGRAFPAFAGISLLDGRPLAVPDEGRVVVVAWDPDCDCTSMFAAVNAAASRAHADAEWVGVVTRGDVATAARRAYEGSHLFPSALDTSGEVAGFLGEDAGPVVIVLDDGEVVAQFGPDVTAGGILDEVQGRR